MEKPLVRVRLWTSRMYFINLLTNNTLVHDIIHHKCMYNVLFSFIYQFEHFTQDSFKLNAEWKPIPPDHPLLNVNTLAWQAVKTQFAFIVGADDI